LRHEGVVDVSTPERRRRLAAALQDNTPS